MSESQIPLSSNLETIHAEIKDAISRRPEELKDDVILIAVSKRMSKNSIIQAYNCGVRHFGENYVHELFDKSNDPEVTYLCPEIHWHFIGHLQRNKVSKLIIGCPNLIMIHTIDSFKLAETVEHSYGQKPCKETTQMIPLPVMIQVNTSGEESKSGIPIEDVENLYLFITNECPHLSMEGFMTIGSPNHDLIKGPNPDFLALVDLRNKFKDKYGVELKLSMGMSQDFQHAIELGATYVRVGEKIFGKRQ